MNLKLMSKQKEQEIAQSVNKAAELAAAGTDPSEAIAKVAMDMGYNENIAKYMTNSYNVSKTLAQFEQFDGEKRAEDFSIAKTDKVLERMRSAVPTTKKASIQPSTNVKDYMAVDMSVADFSAKYITSKVASELDFPDYVLVDRLNKLRDDVNAKIALAHADAATAKIIASDRFFKLAEFLSNLPRGKFAEFEEEALAKHGNVAKIVLDDVFATRDFAALGHTRASKTAAFVDDTKPAHALLDSFLAKIAEAQDLQKVASDLDEAADGVAKDLSPITITKGFGANMTGAVDSLTGFLDKQVLAPISESEGKPDKKFQDVVADVDLKNEFQSAPLTSSLSEIFAEDEVLRNEDPAEVARIAKQQLEISPKLIEHPPILAAAIRRALATRGDVDPFSAKQLFDFTYGKRNTDGTKE